MWVKQGGHSTAEAAQLYLNPAFTPLPVTLPSEPVDVGGARWIWYPSERCLANTFVFFRKTLELPQKPKRAAGWILADTRYRLSVNGARVQWGPAPADPRWLEIDPVDLTEALKEGPNCIGAEACFYGLGDGTSPLGKPGFLFQLEIELETGSPITVISDESWQSMLARCRPSGQYKRWYLRSLQEEFNANLYPVGWNTPDFKTGEDWLPAMVLDCPSDKPPLCSTFPEYLLECSGDRAVSAISPRSIPLLHEEIVPVQQLTESMWIDWKRPPEEYFENLTPGAFEADRTPCATKVDDGAWSVILDGNRGAALTFEWAEQVVGWPTFTIEAPQDTVIEMMVHEAHEPGGPPLLNTHYNSWSRFICKKGTNTFETFDYESLRWLQLHIHNVRGQVTVRNIAVRRRKFPWPNEPQIACSDPDLQCLFDATINTLHNCAQDILVDGMARERQQYSGDCGHQLHAIYFTFGETRLPARYLKTFSQGMTLEGYFLDCWPAYDRLARLMERQLLLTKWGPILDHGIGFNFDCYHHYLYTGDLKALEEPYPRLLRFREYLKSIRDNDGLLRVENIGTPSVWLDHQAYTQTRHKQCAFNLYAAAMLELALAPICRAFNDNANAEDAAAMGREILNATVIKYWSAEDQLFINNLPWVKEEGLKRCCDRSLATAVLFDQCPQGQSQNAVRTLVESPPEMGFSYPANAGWRLWALGKAGRADVIVSDLRKRWSTMDSVRLNNTLQENWTAKADGGSQWSHCPVAPLYVLFMNIAGIQSTEAGFARCVVRPQLVDIESLDLVGYTVKGPIAFHAEGKLGARKIRLALPAGCRGELVLDQRETCTLEPLSGASLPGHKSYKLPSGKEVEIELKVT